MAAKNEDTAASPAEAFMPDVSAETSPVSRAAALAQLVAASDGTVDHAQLVDVNQPQAIVSYEPTGVEHNWFTDSVHRCIVRARYYLREIPLEGVLVNGRQVLERFRAVRGDVVNLPDDAKTGKDLAGGYISKLPAEDASFSGV